MTIIRSNAEVLQRKLITLGVGISPSNNNAELVLGKDWCVFVGVLPDTDKIPAKAIALYDLDGDTQGRIHRSVPGKGYVTIQHPGVAVRVRSENHSSSYNKMVEILDAFAALGRTVISFAEDDSWYYVIHSVNRHTTVRSMGVDEKARRRVLACTVRTNITQQETV